MLARFGECGGDVGAGKAVGQRVKVSRGLIEPEIADQFGGFRGALKPGRLPDDGGDKIGFSAQGFRQGPRGGLRLRGIRRADRDDKFPGIGEIALIQL